MIPHKLFEVSGVGPTMYGICIAVGLLVCLAVFYFSTKKKGMPEKVQDFIFGVIVIAVALGFIFAKLFQAVYNWIEDGEFDFYGAGITAMGGFIGGAAAFLLCYFLAGKYIFKGKDKGLHVREFNKVLLIAPSCIVIAHAFGRLGCLCAGCCHGTYLGQDYVVGGIYMWGTVNGSHKWGYYIPTQLYEALFLFALFGVLTYLYFHRCNFTMAIYLIAYGVWRFFIEIFRADARGAIVLGLAPSQWISFLFIAGGLAMIGIYMLLKIPLIFPKGDKSMLLAPISKFNLEQDSEQVVEDSEIEKESQSDNVDKEE